jgi:prepilin-type N-terminal cleavage/methylation domain-containing protein
MIFTKIHSLGGKKTSRGKATGRCRGRSTTGFTLFEILIAIAIIAVLAGATIYLINPVQQFARSRNVQRQSDINLLLNAVGQNITDNRGTFTCSSGAIPTSSTKMATSAYNIAPCLAPAYLDKLPYDPNAAGAHYASTTDYDTGYFISQSATTNRVTISAPSAELGQTISITR